MPESVSAGFEIPRYEGTKVKWQLSFHQVNYVQRLARLTVVAVELFSSSLVKFEQDTALGFPHS